MKALIPFTLMLVALAGFILGRRSADRPLAPIATLIDELSENSQHAEHEWAVNRAGAPAVLPEDPALRRHADRGAAMHAVGKSLTAPCPGDDVRCRTYRVALINAMPIICGHPQVRSMTQEFARRLDDEPLREWLQMCLESLDHRSPWHNFRRMQSDWYNRDEDYYRPDDLQILEAIYNVARDAEQKALALERFDELALKRWTDSVNHTVQGLGDPRVVRHAHPQPLATMPRWPASE